MHSWEFWFTENRSVMVQTIQIFFLKKQKSENLSDKPKTPFDKPENWSV
jgi:hypothetical protein